MKLKQFTNDQKNTFKELGVSAVYLFGSQANNTANPFSDFDFGVTFHNLEKYYKQPLKIYGKIYDILLDILPKEYLRRRMKMRSHEFDIVFLQTTSPRMKYLATEDGIVLYKSSDRAIFDFKEESLSSYFDFKYFERIQNQAFLNI